MMACRFTNLTVLLTNASDSQGKRGVDLKGVLFCVFFFF